MIATIEYIEKKFQEYNELMFEGKLKPLPFKLTTARTFLGQVRFYQEKNPDGTMHYMNFQFVISTKVDLPESEVEDTIIHEMIHYWILSNQMQDTGPHGEIFKKKMKEINVKFNRNLSVAHKVTKDEADRDDEVRQHLICVSRLRNGKRGVTVATKSRLFQLWDDMANFPNMAEVKWVVSTDPYFNRFPRCTSAKIYPVPSEELAEHLKDSKELVRTGNNIRIKK
jgi:predicted SprT family Zn-dependent metalloprotease